MYLSHKIVTHNFWADIHSAKNLDANGFESAHLESLNFSFFFNPIFFTFSQAANVGNGHFLFYIHQFLHFREN